MSPQIATSIGIPVLDNHANRAYLQQNHDQGQPFLTLMMLDSEATSVFDRQQVTAAWQLYSAPGSGYRAVSAALLSTADSAAPFPRRFGRRARVPDRIRRRSSWRRSLRRSARWATKMYSRVKGAWEYAEAAVNRIQRAIFISLQGKLDGAVRSR